MDHPGECNQLGRLYYRERRVKDHDKQGDRKANKGNDETE